jgi:hypothetical protein
MACALNPRSHVRKVPVGGKNLQRSRRRFLGIVLNAEMGDRQPIRRAVRLISGDRKQVWVVVTEAMTSVQNSEVKPGRKG